jgi:anthranilate synthase component II
MILLIDNYDSFSYNLVQVVGAICPDIRVVRNDKITVEEISDFHPDAIILSPGPGKPKDAGICIEVVHRYGGQIPILGVCLGHQAICEAYGGTVTYAKTLMHGKQSTLKINNRAPIFDGLPEEIAGGRYHSLALAEVTLPKELTVLARADDGEIMAVGHFQYPVYGLQFHPESILTPNGSTIIKNFLEDKQNDYKSN